MTGRSVFIGASMSGIEALRTLAGLLPADFPAPIFVVQHVGPSSPGYLPEILSRAGPLRAVHPRDGEEIEPARIYVAPPDHHMLVDRKRVRLSHGPRENHVRPAVDPLFRSAAVAHGGAAIGVVLTGNLDDGTAGLLAIKDCGGTAIVQDPAEAPAPSMPRSALRHVRVDHQLTLKGIAETLVALARDDPFSAGESSDLDLMLAENHIVAGVFGVADWAALEQRSIASGLNCPQCRSALYEIRDPRILRFRCRSGHGYSALSLASAQTEAHEAQLACLFGLAAEEASLARRISTGAGIADDARSAAFLRDRISLLEGEAEQLAGWLNATARVAPPPGH